MTPTIDGARCLESWERIAPDEARGIFRFPPELPVFAGHFPGAAVLPGVYQLGAIVALCVRATQREGLRPRRLEKVKWIRPVAPGQVLYVHLRWSEEGGELRVRAETTTDGDRSCQAQLVLDEM